MGAERTPSGAEVDTPHWHPPDDVLAAHLSGELSEAEAGKVAAHLDVCSACSEVVVNFQRGVRTLPDALSDALATRPVEKIEIDSLPSIELTPRSVTGAFAGRYQIKRLLGTGGMGSVYEALDLNLHRLIALKVLRLPPDRPAERMEAANRLIREARAMAVLSHRNVVAVYDVGLHEDQVFVAMQLVDGATLRVWLAAGQRSTRSVLRVLADAGAGLAAAHAARLIHRDFKPDNVLISRRGTARVTDFGLARRADLHGDLSSGADRASRPKIVEIDATPNVTRTGAVVGTPAYMAPEQAQGQPCDARADQFSFCVTAWEALYGQRPFGGTTWSEIYSNVVNGNIMDTAECERFVPRDVQRALRRGLSVDPQDRFESMPELLRVLENAIGRPRRWQRRAMVTAIATAAAAAAVAGYSQAPRMLGKQDDPGAGSGPTLRVEPIEGVPAPLVVTLVDAAMAALPAPEPVRVVDDDDRDRDRDKDKKDRDKDRDRDKASGAPPGAGSADPFPAPAGPAPRLRLDEITSRMKALEAERRRRELAVADLPRTYADGLAAAEAAIDAADAQRAQRELERARTELDGVRVDAAFVALKRLRIVNQIEQLAEKRDEYDAVVADLDALIGAGDHEAANRKLNEIAALLAADR